MPVVQSGIGHPVTGIMQRHGDVGAFEIVSTDGPLPGVSFEMKQTFACGDVQSSAHADTFLL
jgi:hypothetical protein